MFVRIKKIKGIPYAYLVKNTWKKGKTIQKTVKYLGRVIGVKPLSESLDLSLDSMSSPKDLFYSLVNKQLLALGFKPKNKTVYFNKELNVEFNFRSLSFKQQNKNCVLKLNEGFVCDYNLKRLRKVIEGSVSCRDEDFYDSGKELARALVDLGFILQKDQFQKLIFGILKLREENSKKISINSEFESNKKS